MYWEEKANYASIFITQPILAFQARTRAVACTLPFCAFGASVQKYVTFLATPGVASGLAPVAGLVCTHSTHSGHAYGEDADGGSAAVSTMPYPALLCTILARAHLKLTPRPESQPMHLAHRPLLTFRVLLPPLPLATVPVAPTSRRVTTRTT